jgi:elongation factor G
MSKARRKPVKSLKRLRNIGIIAHIDAGKTTLTERILFYSHRIHRMGEVHDGNATMDFMPEEQERGITITSACTSVDWRDFRINVIDTPGHVDFTIEVERSLRVLDGAVGVFSAVEGVEPQSETVWRQSERYKVPKLAFVNKMDRVGADFERVLQDMETKLGARPVAVTVPDGQGAELTGIFDLIRGRRICYDPDSFGQDFQERDMAPEEWERLGPWREKLIETAADHDDTLLEAYLAGETVDEERLKAGLREAVLGLSAVPVFAGSALKNTGVQPVLDAVCDLLPSPLDVPPIKGMNPDTRQPRVVEASQDEPFTALAFKVTLESGRKLVLMRIYAGTLESGATVYNQTRQVEERVARLFTLHAGRKEKVELAAVGDIVAAAGMKHARTGDTLTLKGNPVILERISEYKPVISLALEPHNSEEADKLTEVLERYLLEDPTLRVEADEETGQMILSGMGELHLQVILERLRREYGLEPRSGRPQVVYQETVAASGKAEAVFHKELGETMHHGQVALVVDPLPRDKGMDIVFEVDTRETSGTLVDAVYEGVEDGLQAGVLKGFPVQDVRVRIKNLVPRDGESTPVGFRLAASMALKQALEDAGPLLLEPIMWIEVSVPEEFTGEVIGLLSSKGAKIENLYDKAGQKTVQALAPLAALFGVSTELRSASQGRAGLMMKFFRFDVLEQSAS